MKSRYNANYKLKVRTTIDMQIKISSPIFGFEDIKKMELNQLDKFFYTLKEGDISFTLIDPSTIREYNPKIPNSYKTSLDLNSKSDIRFFTIITILNPIEKSTINFLAPLVLNQKNQFLVQVPLDENQNKDLSIADPIGKYI